MGNNFVLQKLEQIMSINYAALRDAVSKLTDSKPAQANLLTTLKLWLECFSLTWDSQPENHLASGFNESLETYRKFLDSRGIRPQTRNDRTTLMRRWESLYSARRQAIAAPEDFPGALTNAMDARGYAVKDIAGSSHSAQTQLRAWMAGTCQPSRSSIPVLQAIEKKLGLRPQYLINRIAHFYGDTPEGAEYSQTPHRKKLRASRGSSLFLHDWPETLKAEWMDLLRHKTSILPKGIRRSSSWRLKPASSMPDKYSWGGTVGNSVCPAGELNFHRVANLLGFAAAPAANGGFGLGEQVLTLATMADSNLVVSYLEYLKERSGVHHEGGLSVLRMVRSLVRPEYGYLWQYAEKYGPLYHEEKMSAQQWKEHCAEAYHHLGEVSRHLLTTGQVVKSRDPKEPIQAILDRQHPTTALFELISAMEKHSPHTRWKGRLAVFMRDLLHIKLLTANPLRAHHFCIMTYRKDNTGNLFQMPDGSWWLRFQPSDFKNQRGAAGSEYKVRVAPWVWPAIEGYLKKHRKHLAGPHTDFVFRPKINKKGEGSDRMLTPGEMGARLQKWTHKYLPNCPGFRAHAFRHIIATDFIKNHPQSFMIAATILHDKIDTVMKHYAHLKKSDEFEAYNNYQEQVRELAMAEN